MNQLVVTDIQKIRGEQQFAALVKPNFEPLRDSFANFIYYYKGKIRN